MLLVLTFSAAAQAEDIVWLEDTYNFGMIKEEDGNVTCTMRFVNNSSRKISVLSARASCGCTQPKYPKESINPGDTAAIEVTYLPAGRPGRFEKTVNVTFSPNTKSTLTVKGIVIGTSKTIEKRFPCDAGVMKLRSSTVMLGEVRKGRTKTEFLDAYNISADTIYPQWEGLPDYMGIAPGSDFIAPADYASYAFYINSIKCPKYGLVKETVTLYPNGKQASDPVEVEVMATVVDDFSKLSDAQRLKAPVIATSPEKINFGVITPMTNLTATFSIKNNGENEMIIRRIYSTDPAIGVQYKKDRVKSGKSVEVTVTVNSFALPEEILNSCISIVTNCPDDPIHELRVVGEIAK